ncbi:MAG: hypothetical protein Q7J73_03740 [Dehalococcoidales bacterium]|nr:hypothetical protein [Dehalococcoidales bacterium]
MSKVKVLLLLLIVALAALGFFLVSRGNLLKPKASNVPVKYPAPNELVGNKAVTSWAIQVEGTVNKVDGSRITIYKNGSSLTFVADQNTKFAAGTSVAPDKLLNSLTSYTAGDIKQGEAIQASLIVRDGGNVPAAIIISKQGAAAPVGGSAPATVAPQTSTPSSE